MPIRWAEEASSMHDLVIDHAHIVNGSVWAGTVLRAR